MRESCSALLVAGPTAVGKSAVALCLAELLKGEIISVDSMQVYRGLDIGTAKPTLEERQRVPHHLIDVVELSESFDAARFVALAHEAVQVIVSRGRVPIFCGGTGLYFRAWLEGLGEAPTADPGVRAELESTALPELLGELAARDPVTYARIDRSNRRRVVRALEVIRLTGKPFAAQRASWQPTAARPAADQGIRLTGLRRSPEDLRARIDARVEAMFARGLVEETRALLGRGLERNRTALQALGYRQIVEHLRGERSVADTVTEVKRRSWHYARRQLTWFRHQLPVEWLDLSAEEPAASVARRLIALATVARRGGLA